MTPVEFKEARQKLGLTAAKCATALGIAEGRSIRRYESGSRAIPWEISQRLIRLNSDLPEFLIASDPEAENDSGFFIVPRNWPEMIIRVTDLDDGSMDLTIVGAPHPSLSQDDLFTLLRRADAALRIYEQDD